MKITIVQREIEDAIRAYIHSQITVNEGMEITMDFTATRGDDGLIAAIDISPAKEPEPAPKATRAPRAASVVAAPAPRVVQEQPTHAEPVEAEEETQAEQSVSSAPVSEDESLVDGDQPLKPSIFSSLRRPTNDASEGAAA